MSLRVSHTSVDCTDAYALSQWWKPVLGYRDIPDDPNEPGHQECMIEDPETHHRLLFLEVPDRGTAKNVVHLDLCARDGSTRDEEVERVLALGAVLHADLRGTHGPGTGWVTLRDPEGNLFCVVRSDAERGEAG
jgi:hypothetical protein